MDHPTEHFFGLKIFSDLIIDHYTHMPTFHERCYPLAPFR
jgi:hypothetical protein